MKSYNSKNPYKGRIFLIFIINFRTNTIITTPPSFNNPYKENSSVSSGGYENLPQEVRD